MKTPAVDIFRIELFFATSFKYKSGNTNLSSKKYKYKNFFHDLWIAYKRSDEWDIKGQQVTTSGRTGDNERRRVTTNYNSSIVDEVIKVILNYFISFLQEDFTPTKSTKHIQVNKNKKRSIFIRIKNI